MSKANKRERQRQNREQRREYETQLAKRRKSWKTARTFALIALPVIAIGVVLNLTNSGDDGTKKSSSSKAAACTKVDAPEAKDDGTLEAPALTIDPAVTYLADVETNCGSFTITLDAAQAPQTVNSFVSLARQGFYDGLVFHRVVKGFVAQGGDPKGDGTGSAGYTLPDEPPADGYRKGTVAMANSGPGTSGSGFFIASTAAGAQGLGGPPYLYSILGQVTSGLTTIEKMDALGSTTSDGGDRGPKQPIVIQRISIVESPPVAP